MLGGFFVSDSKVRMGLHPMSARPTGENPNSSELIRTHSTSLDIGDLFAGARCWHTGGSKSPENMRLKTRSNSFAARLTAGQRDELFTTLGDGLSYKDAALRVLEWYQENAAARHPGWGDPGQLKAPCPTCICAWYRAALTKQRYAVAKEVAAASQTECPADFDEQARLALGQARYLATLEGLSVSALTALERNELTREKIDLERDRLALATRRQNCDELIAKAQQLLENAPTQASNQRKHDAFQFQIDLALEEIEHMKYGDDYLTRSPKMREKYTDQNIPPPSARLGPGYKMSDEEFDE